MLTKKKAVILFNSSNLSGLEKHDAAYELIAKCQQDNYAISRVFYYKDHYDHALLHKLIKMVRNSPRRITVILAKDYEQSANNFMIHFTLGTLAATEQIELCFYEYGITLSQVQEGPQLMQKAMNYQKQLAL